MTTIGKKRNGNKGDLLVVFNKRRVLGVRKDLSIAGTLFEGKTFKSCAEAAAYAYDMLPGFQPVNRDC